MRTRKEQHWSSMDHHEEMANHTPDAKAARAFVRKAYQSYDVAGYLAKKKCNVKGEIKE